MVALAELIQPGLSRPTVRRAGLVVRVSTDRQAMTEEGSLKNQLQRLRQHIQYKTVAAGEDWAEAAVYELRAVSGKDSLRSPEFERLFTDIKMGRVNTILCTALDRISRSVKDFLRFFEVLAQYGVEFVCLKQNYDTTTSQGKLFITIMMALAEFEREQTSERNREATAARADRGLFSGGGRVLGYDPDPSRKGYLIPNSEEALIVNLAFDTYLECGSIAETAERLNRLGYRSKAYSSRRGKHHTGSPFRISTVQGILRNAVYVAQKEVNKTTKRPGRSGAEYRLVDAVWSPIVESEKFERVQELLRSNKRGNGNGAKPVKHTYVLSGFLRCGRCETSMQGRSGIGRLGVRYYYYVCGNRECGLRVTARGAGNLRLRAHPRAPRRSGVA